MPITDTNAVPSELSGIAHLEAGSYHVLALRTNGTVATWGFDSSGQGTVPEEITGVTAIAAGGNHNLVVTAQPRFISITPPVNASVGQNITFSVAAGGGPLTYQWQHSGTNLPNQASATFTIASVMAAHAGPYSVVVSNAYGYITPRTALNLPPPAISAQPTSRTVYRSENVSFTVSASGFDPLTYRWLHNGTNVVGANSATLTLPTVDAAQAGKYRVVVTDVTETSVQSAEAMLNIIDPR